MASLHAVEERQKNHVHSLSIAQIRLWSAYFPYKGAKRNKDENLCQGLQVMSNGDLHQTKRLSDWLGHFLHKRCFCKMYNILNGCLLFARVIFLEQRER